MAAQETPVTRRLQSVKNIILVLSGKGGVGKSSVSTQLALKLYASSPNARVGILDVDLTGPSIPRMFGIDDQGVHQSSNGWVPVYADGTAARLACMSVGFLLKNKNDSVVWRGPKKNGMIRQFLSDVRWGDLDYLVIDTPPGSRHFFKKIFIASDSSDHRYIRWAFVSYGAPSITTFTSLSRHSYDTSSGGSYGRNEVPLVHSSSQPPCTWTNRKHEWICLSVLWGDQ